MKIKTLSLIVISSLLISCNSGLDDSVGEEPTREIPFQENPLNETSEVLPAEIPVDLNLPIFLTTMTHMESNFLDDQDEKVFQMHIKNLTYAMDLADEYDATLTIESENPFSIANKLWDVNFMQEILNRGHGVGTHCDLGGPNEISDELLTQQALENKELVDKLVGEENNSGCSGLGSSADWITAAQDAGFTYINGIVGFHLLAIPYEERPEEWTDEEIFADKFHFNVPLDIMGRIYLIQLKDAEDWKDDGQGIVVSNGELGKLAHLKEGSREACSGPQSSCDYGTDDVDTLIALIKEVDTNRDPSRVAKLSLYFPVTDWNQKNKDVLSYFFEEMQKLQNEGVIQWASQKEVVDTYLELEA
jgi:hypothetical protein